MDRRHFLVTSLAGALAVPLVAGVQAPKYRIGVLEVVDEAANAVNLEAFRQALRQLGYLEGQNLAFEYRSANGRTERFSDLAGEF